MILSILNFRNKVRAQKPKTLGQLGEEFAQEEYKKKGFKIIASNFFNIKGLRKGEVDFIATNADQIVFVEVKTRHGQENKFGSGVEAVDIYKQTKLLKAVKIFLLQNPKYFDLRPRIDVCVIEFSQIDKKFRCAKIITNAVEDNS